MGSPKRSCQVPSFFPNPPIDEVETADGCKRHNDDALRIAKWIIHDNEDGIGYTTKTAFQFLFMWMTNTPDFKFDVIGSDLLNEGGAELTMVYVHRCQRNMST